MRDLGLIALITFVVFGLLHPQPQQIGLSDQAFQPSQTETLYYCELDEPRGTVQVSYLFRGAQLIPRLSTRVAEWQAKEGESEPWGWHRFEEGRLWVLMPTRTWDDGEYVFQWQPDSTSWRRRGVWVCLALLFIVAGWKAVRDSALLDSGRSEERTGLHGWTRAAYLLGSAAAGLALLVKPGWGWGALAGLPATLRCWHDLGPAFLLVMAVACQVNWRISRRFRFDHVAIPSSLLLICGSYVWLVAVGPADTVIVDQTAYSAPFCSAVSQSDAQQYEIGAYALATTGELPEWNQRRPINTVWSFLRTWIVGMHPLMGLGLQAILMALAVGRLVQEVSRLMGGPAGLFVLACCWGMIRFFIATPLTESLGFGVGALGMAWFLRGHRCSQSYWSLFGIGLLALAQAARPGALLMLPLLGFVWSQFTAERSLGLVNRLLRLSGAAGVVVLALAVNSWMNRVYGTADNSSGSNFAYTFAGLASGCSWEQIEAEFHDQLQQLENEKAQADFLYRIGWQRMVAQPGVFIGELVRGGKRFCIDAPAALWAMATHTPIGEGWLPRVEIALWWLLIGILCIVKVSRDRDRPWTYFVLAIVGGTMLSAMVVYLDGGIRVFAASWPALFVVLAMGCRQTMSDGPDATSLASRVATRHYHCELLLTTVLIAVGCCLPWLVVPLRATAKAIDKPLVARQTTNVEIGYVGVPLAINTETGEGYDLRQFQRAIQLGRLPIAASLFEVASRKPKLLQSCFDVQTQRQWYLFGDRSQVGGQSTFRPGESVTVEVISVQPPIGFVREPEIVQKRGIDGQG